MVGECGLLICRLRPFFFEMLPPPSNQGQFNEADLTIYYHRYYHQKFLNDKLRFKARIYRAIFSNGNPCSLDFGTGSLETDIALGCVFGPVELFSYVGVWLVDAPGSVWGVTGVRHMSKLSLHFQRETVAGVGVGTGILNKAHIAEVGIQANLFEWCLVFPWQPIKGLKAVPHRSISYIIPQVLRQAMEQPTHIWGGVGFNYSINGLA